MKKSLSLLTILLACFVLVGCGTSGSIKDTVAPESVVEEEIKEDSSVPTEPVPVEAPTENTTGEFDPDAFEDEEIDELLGMLEGLVEG